MNKIYKGIHDQTVWLNNLDAFQNDTRSDKVHSIKNTSNTEEDWSNINLEK